MTPERLAELGRVLAALRSEGKFTDAWAAIAYDLLAEVERLQAGKFTEEEFQNLCHGFDDADFCRFRRGCEEYQAKLFGFSAAVRAKRTPEWIEKASKRYEGQVEPCCECGEDYPKADLVFRQEIYCPKCRIKEQSRCP